MSTSTPPDPTAAPRHIPHEERLTLWVRSGGRCAICNKYLLEDEFTAQPVGLAELAHNVGRKLTEGSPRGEDELPVSERNKADNLLLLCGDHHRTIDAKVTRDEYTVEALRELKRRHEDRVRYVTGLGEDMETVVLRVVGTIRDASVELSAETVRKAVAAHAGRYPRYALGFGGADIEIDLRDMPSEGSESYWNTARERIEDVIDGQIGDGVTRGQLRHLSVFGFARIPLLALVGFHLDDKIPTDIYQKQRGSDEAWQWDPSADAVSFDAKLAREGDTSRVAVVLSISGTIPVDDLPDEVADTATVWMIEPIGETPNRDIFRSRESLERFASCYHNFLSSIEHEHPDADEIDVFPAVPLSAAITLGRGLMRNVHPLLRIYEPSDSGRFAPSVELNR